ncbi:MAG: hypothetical protein CMK06_00690 [Ponticaulis sp.]|nr:hypothetical protein [Ponticaulis sp.]
MAQFLKWSFVLGGAIAAVLALYVTVGVYGLGLGLIGIFLVHVSLRKFSLAGTPERTRLDERMDARRERVRRAHLREDRESSASD